MCKSQPLVQWSSKDPPVKPSNIITIPASVSSISSAVKSKHVTATTAEAEVFYQSTSFVIAKESLRCLWALNNDGASKSSSGAGIHVVGSFSTSGYGSNGGTHEFKLFFPQRSTLRRVLYQRSSPSTRQPCVALLTNRDVTTLSTILVPLLKKW